MMEDHFCALDWQAVDQQATDIDPGDAESMIIRYLVETFFQRHGYPVDNATIQAAELEPGPVSEDIRTRGNGYQC